MLSGAELLSGRPFYQQNTRVNDSGLKEHFDPSSHASQLQADVQKSNCRFLTRRIKVHIWGREPDCDRYWVRQKDEITHKDDVP